MAFQGVSFQPGSRAAFRDAEGFPIVGGRCSLRTCNMHDFLPVQCGFCKASFCDSHAAPSEHDCPRAPAAVAGKRATICPACEETLRWEATESSEEAALMQHLATCPGRPSQKELCPRPGCGVVLGLLNAFTCPLCHQKVCVEHRFEDAHPCCRRPAQAAPNAPAAAPRPAEPASPVGQLTQARAPPMASPQQLSEARAGLEGTTVARGECLYAIRRRLSDISREPANAQLRVLRRDDKEVSGKILAVRGSEALLTALGFQAKDGVLELPSSVGKGRVDFLLQRLA